MTHTTNQKVRVLSGIRASHSSLHLGNLLGAIRGMVALQDNPNYETYYMVADLHGITTPYKVEELRENRINVAIEYLAAGIDPNRSALFLQSAVPEHTELAYLLSVAVPPNKLRHLPAYKDKVLLDKFPDNMALLNYPVLMSADILLYKAQEVPIGPDQESHLEVARGIAKVMNSRYGLDFPEPKSFSKNNEQLMIPSILGAGKMSKSKSGSAIFLTDDLETIRKKIGKMPTDSGKGEVLPTKNDQVFALFTLVEILLGIDVKKQLENDYLGNGAHYSDYKDQLVNSIVKLLLPIQTRRLELSKDSDKVREILEMGAERARAVAKVTIREVKERMGLL